MESLILGKHSGAPKKLSDAQESELLTVIFTKTPEEEEIRNIFQYPWNAQSFSVSGAELYQTDLYIEYSRSQKSRNSSEKLLKIKKLLNNDIFAILFEYESMIRDYQTIMKTWYPKGKLRKIPTYGKHEVVKLVSWKTLQSTMYSSIPVRKSIRPYKALSTGCPPFHRWS